MFQFLQLQVLLFSDGALNIPDAVIHVIPVIAEMETLKERIQLNGHFKDLKGFDV